MKSLGRGINSRRGRSSRRRIRMMGSWKVRERKKEGKGKTRRGIISRKSNKRSPK